MTKKRAPSALKTRPRRGHAAPHVKTAPAKPPLSPAEMEARLLYRDALILIIDKPAGLPVHAGPGGGPNLEDCFDALRFGLPKPPALAHRLDRDTSGCLVLGRHRKALAKTSALFRDGRIEKTYWAVVSGAPAAKEGLIDLPLSKETRRNGWRMIADREKGLPSQTFYRVLGQSNGHSWIECRPKTGRTHQIRVHLAALGCPIAGDPIYGKSETGAAEETRSLHLHARAIAIPLYDNRPPIAVTAPPPASMLPLLKACGWDAERNR